MTRKVLEVELYMYTFVTFFSDIFFILYRSCLHPLHFIGCFSYVFALYTFVTFFFFFFFFFLRERFANFLEIC